MPYTVTKEGDKWVVRSPHGVKGKHKTKAEAEAQRKAILANMHGKMK